MIGAEEHRHVDANFGDQDGGDQPIDAGDLHQQDVLDTIGLQLLRDPPVEGRNILLSCVEPAQLHREQETVVLFHPTIKCQNQLGVLAA